MKTISLLITIILLYGSIRETKKVESKVYSFSDARIEKTATGEKRQLIDGETTHLENFEIHTTTINPGKVPHGSHIHSD